MIFSSKFLTSVNNQASGIAFVALRSPGGAERTMAAFKYVEMQISTLVRRFISIFLKYLFAREP